MAREERETMSILFFIKKTKLLKNVQASKRNVIISKNEM